MKLAVRADGRGIYHEKIGVFLDAIGNTVTFKGSTNETWGGWHRLRISDPSKSFVAGVVDLRGRGPGGIKYF